MLQKRKSPVRGLVQMASQTNVARRSMIPMPMRACSKVTATTPKTITHFRFSHHAAGSLKNLATDAMSFFLLSIPTQLLSNSCYRAKKPLCRNSTGYVADQLVSDQLRQIDSCHRSGPWLRPWVCSCRRCRWTTADRSKTFRPLRS